MPILAAESRPCERSFIKITEFILRQDLQINVTLIQNARLTVCERKTNNFHYKPFLKFTP